MGVKEKATALHESGFNCAQAVLSALGEYTGLDEKTALAIGSGFGGGMRCGEICGSISGGVMALGMVFPFQEEGDMAAKSRINKMCSAYVKAFSEQYGGCVRCRELKGAGYSCAELIERAAELAEKTILENQ